MDGRGQLGKPRPLIYRSLELTPGMREDAQRHAEDAVAWALRLLYEDEVALLAEDREDDIALGRWLTRIPPRVSHSQQRSTYAVVAERLPRVIKALVAMRLVPDFEPQGQFRNVTSIADAALMGRATAFAGWAPRALLLPHLIHAYFIALAGEPRLASLTFSSHMGWGGPGATAPGLCRVNGGRTISSLGGFSGLGRDVVVHYSSIPYTVGFDNDGFTPAGEEDLRPFGFATWPSTHAEHFELPLRIAAGARAILQRARAGSKACGSARIDPAIVLERAFPPWLTVGALPSGIAAMPMLGPARHDLPGGDPDLLRAAINYRMRPIFTLFDTAAPEASRRALRDVFVVDAAANVYSGQQFMAQVCSAQRLHPDAGLREESAAELRAVGQRPAFDTLGIDIDPRAIKWLWLRRGLRIAENGNGKGLSLGVVLRASDDHRVVAYVVDTDLAVDERRADVIARAHLHFLHSNGDRAYGGCAGRVHHEYELHLLKSWKHQTRSWMRGAMLSSNVPLVVVGRRHQSRQPA